MPTLTPNSLIQMIDTIFSFFLYLSWLSTPASPKPMYVLKLHSADVKNVDVKNVLQN